jgi:hypothetical protein
MFRKLTFAAVAAAGLLAPMTLTPAVQAHEIHHRWRFEVIYRDPCSPNWIIAGRFHDRHEVERVAAHCRHRGFAVSIR